MMRKSTASSMQKTYDECYLICSTAIYFEGQGNEAEALRSWRSALDRIYYHNAYRMPQDYRARTETDKALQDSLRDMELQCKERVTLLEALRDSRVEAAKDGGSSGTGAPSMDRTFISKAPQSSLTLNQGVGSIPSVSYPDLAKPALPVRPAAAPRKSSDLHTGPVRGVGNALLDIQKPLSPNPPPVSQKMSRTPSPEKKGRMKMTLRDGRPAKKPASKGKGSSSKPPAASKAAGLAWDTTVRIPSPNQTPDGTHAGGYFSGRDQQLRESDYSRRSSADVNRREPSSSVQTPVAYHADKAGPADAAPSTYQAKSMPDTWPASPRVATQESPSAKMDYGKPSPDFLRYRKEYPAPTPVSKAAIAAAINGPRPSEPTLPPTDDRAQSSTQYEPSLQRKPISRPLPPKPPAPRRGGKPLATSSESAEETTSGPEAEPRANMKKPGRAKRTKPLKEADTPESSEVETEGDPSSEKWEERLAYVKKHLPKGVDPHASKQIFNEIVVRGDEVHWTDVAGLDAAKKALKEAVVYPFLRPDLFMGLREPARGMLLFGPPGTGKTMLARAVATESRATFFAISASSLTSKWLGDSEKLVRALFGLARALAPSIIFVDEIDSLLSSRGGSSEHESTRRVKTEFLIQWSDLQRAAAGSEANAKEGDASRVLVLAATNMPWAIDEAARRRFVRRQYIPLPERRVRGEQLGKLLSHQKHSLDREDIEVLVRLTDGYSGSDITALAKDAAMGPLRSLGEALLHMSRDEIRPISFEDFEASLVNIRPSVSKQGLKEFEDWARDFGERGA